jgi:hypothetical protein
VHDVCVDVMAASEGLLRAVDDLLAPFAAPEHAARAPKAITLRLSPRKAPPMPDGRAEWFTYPPLCCTADARHGYSEYDGRYMARLTLASGAISVWVPPRLGIDRWMLGHAVVLPLLLEALRGHGLASLHAAALCYGGQAVLLPGASGSGKSTLSVALMRGGFALLADDAPFARRAAEGIMLCAFPEPINVTGATAGFFPELAPRWRRAEPDARGKVGFAAADLGGTVVQSAPVAVVLFPSIGEEACSRVAPLAKSDALSRLLGMSMPAVTAACGREQFLLLADLVRQADCYTLVAGRDFDALPALVRWLLHAPGAARDQGHPSTPGEGEQA